MGYREALHEARRARLRRMGVAAPAAKPLSCKLQPSQDGVSAASRVELVADSRAEIAQPPTECTPPPDRPAPASNASKRRPTIEAIKAVVAAAYGITASDLQKKSREIKYLTPRMIAIHLARRHTVWTLVEIARHFGRSGHATARYADRRMIWRRVQDPTFDAELCELEDCLRTRR